MPSPGPCVSYRLQQLDEHGLLLVHFDDEGEDMAAATSVGMAGYLVTDCRIPYPARPWRGPRGTFADMVDMLRALKRPGD